MQARMLSTCIVGVAVLVSLPAFTQVVFYDDSCDKSSLAFSNTTQTFIAPQDGFITTVAAGVGLFGTPYNYDLTIAAGARSDFWPNQPFTARCCYDPCVPGNNMAFTTLPVPFQVFNGELVSVTFEGAGGDLHYDTPTSTLRMYVTGVGCMQSTGLAGGQWKLISLPCMTVDSVNNLFGDDGLGVYGVDWAVLERDVVADSYRQLLPADPMIQGAGYWIKVLAGTPTIGIEGNATPLVDFVTPLMADVAPGRWNMLGHPFEFPVPWELVRVYDIISTLDYALSDVTSGNYINNRTAYVWNGSSYQSYHPVSNPGSLGLYDGFWVQVIGTPADLVIPPALKKAGGPPQLDRGEWYIQLTVSSEAYSDPGNRLGALLEARGDWDEYDLRELQPFSTPFLTLVFPHPEWGGEAWAYTTDFRNAKKPAAGEWSFEVRSDVRRTITLSWATGGDADTVLKRSVLIDRELDQVIRPRPGGSYTVEMAGPTHRFMWRVKPVTMGTGGN